MRGWRIGNEDMMHTSSSITWLFRASTLSRRSCRSCWDEAWSARNRTNSSSCFSWTQALPWSQKCQMSIFTQAKAAKKLALSLLPSSLESWLDRRSFSVCERGTRHYCAEQQPNDDGLLTIALSLSTITAANLILQASRSRTCSYVHSQSTRRI